MTKFFVFSFMKRDVREGTGLVGLRDLRTFDTEKEAECRRKDLKKEHDPKVLRRIIRREVWS